MLQTNTFDLPEGSNDLPFEFLTNSTIKKTNVLHFRVIFVSYSCHIDELVTCQNVLPKNNSLDRQHNVSLDLVTKAGPTFIAALLLI